MLVNIGNVTAFPDARADGVQGAKVLEEAAEVFCAWQDYDKSVFLANDRDNHTATRKCLDSWVDADRDNLLYELSDLLMACENMLAGLDARRKGEFECEVATLTKESVMRVLVLSSVVHHLSSEWSVVKASFYRSELMDNVRALEELACSIVAALGVTDFRPYMEACERAAIAAWNDANACCDSCGLFGDGLCLESAPYEPVHPDSRCPSWRAPGWDDDKREGER